MIIIIFYFLAGFLISIWKNKKCKKKYTLYYSKTLFNLNELLDPLA